MYFLFKAMLLGFLILGGICNVMQCHDNLIDDSGRLVFMMTVIEMLILMM